MAVAPRLRRLLEAQRRRGPRREGHGAGAAHERLVRHLSARPHGPAQRAAEERRSELRDKHRLLLGPWDHSAYYNKRPSCAGQRDFGAEVITGPDTLAATLFQWFDHWLKGEGEGFMPDHKIRYFQMGENVWKETNAWPPAHEPCPTTCTVRAREHRMGDGALDARPPAGEPADAYVYDPFDPVPTRGGRSMIDVLPGVENQADVEERQDVLVYTTPRLTEALAITGPVTVTLYASSSAPDTDFTAKLVDVEPDGYCANIADGIVRARYRRGTDREEFLDAGRGHRVPHRPLGHGAHLPAEPPHPPRDLEQQLPALRPQPEFTRDAGTRPRRGRPEGVAAGVPQQAIPVAARPAGRGVRAGAGSRSRIGVSSFLIG